MSLRPHLLRILSILTILGGGAFLMAGSTSAKQPAACALCGSGCPYNLAEFCATQGCGVGGSCTYYPCPGVDGGWYEYKIDCPTLE